MCSWAAHGFTAAARAGAAAVGLPQTAGIARAVWQRVNLAWALFFAALGALNLYVAFRMSENTWVNFKVYGLTALLFVFGLAQALWLTRRAGQAGP